MVLCPRNLGFCACPGNRVVPDSRGHHFYNVFIVPIGRDNREALHVSELRRGQRPFAFRLEVVRIVRYDCHNLPILELKVTSETPFSLPCEIVIGPDDVYERVILHDRLIVRPLALFETLEGGDVLELLTKVGQQELLQSHGTGVDINRGIRPACEKRPSVKHETVRLQVDRLALYLADEPLDLWKRCFSKADGPKPLGQEAREAQPIELIHEETVGVTGIDRLVTENGEQIVVG